MIDLTVLEEVRTAVIEVGHDAERLSKTEQLAEEVRRLAAAVERLTIYAIEQERARQWKE